MAKLTLSSATSQKFKNEDPQIDEILQRGWETILNHQQRMAAAEARKNKGSGLKIQDIKAGTENPAVEESTGFSFNKDAASEVENNFNALSNQYLGSIQNGYDAGTAFFEVAQDRNDLSNTVDMINESYESAKSAITLVQQNDYHTSANSQNILFNEVDSANVEMHLLNRKYNTVGTKAFDISNPSGKKAKERYLNTRQQLMDAYPSGHNIDVESVVKGYKIQNREAINENIIGEVNGKPIFKFGYADIADVSPDWESRVVSKITKQPNVLYKEYSDDDVNVILSGLEDGSATAIDIRATQKFNLDMVKSYALNEWNAFNQNNVAIRSGYTQKGFVDDIVNSYTKMNLRADNTLRTLSAKMSKGDAKKLLNVTGTYNMFAHGQSIAHSGIKDWWKSRSEAGLYANGKALPLPDWNSFVDSISATQLADNNTITQGRPGVTEQFNSVFALTRSKISKAKDNQYLVYDMVPQSGSSIRKVDQGGYHLSTLYFPENLEIKTKEGASEQYIGTYDDTKFFNRQEPTGSNLVPWSNYQRQGIDLQTYGDGASAQTSLPGDVVSVRAAYALYNEDGTFNKIYDKASYDSLKEVYDNSSNTQSQGDVATNLFNNIKPVVIEGIRFNNMLSDNNNNQTYANPNFESNFIYGYNIRPFDAANSMSLERDYADISKIASDRMDQINTVEYSEQRGNTTTGTTNDYLNLSND